ncbi:sigma-54-dependent transcriptional regulator [Thalassotalea sp. ND16A]|uniref:sigma-54-dependent transcriptional regulator n=1 Tax=Thalassotalea sp. ND16A TaxID=1535422 RepID=UPI00051A5B2B|nr:sigma-54 dependent transcriptional regulator [Thalassotalea sp. ND16A]KGJ97974.1 response regulator receiver protein [Thalassotalea sp. ND16A]
MSKTILVVDDKADVRLSVSFLLSNHNYQVIEAESPIMAMAMLEQQAIDLILLDMNYSCDTTSGEEGLRFLAQRLNKKITIPVIAMTAWASVELAVQAMQQGAGDFIAKPWDNQRLLQVVKQQLRMQGLEQQNNSLRQLNAQLQADDELLWVSPKMQQLYKKIERIAQTDATILLTGENGTGKSCIAQMIHRLSTRDQQNFVTVNMGAIPENLFESEMFGHKKGAFTDAKETRAGRFEMAQQGTLFLDEVATIPLSQQAKMLRVLESNEYEMVGSSVTQKTNVRLISASNANFDQMQQQGLFRQDLYYRLNTIELHIPPLRERSEDIMVLAQHFVNKHAQKYQMGELTLCSSVNDVLCDYPWPGNIRELSHVIERAVLMADMPGSGPGVISRDDLQLKQNKTTEQASGLTLMTLESAERQLLQMALKQTNGQVNEAAGLLAISQSAIYRRLEKFDIKTR